MMMMTTLCLAQMPNDTTQWTHQAILDNEGKVQLFWTPGVEDIIFEVHAETKGYIAIGFSPNGGMINADIVVGWVINNAPTLQVSIMLIYKYTFFLACNNMWKSSFGI